jgi:hypothetical protein
MPPKSCRANPESLPERSALSALRRAWERTTSTVKSSIASMTIAATSAAEGSMRSMSAR